jgi:hypothetical protein
MITGSSDLYEPYEESDERGTSFDWEKGGSLQEGVLRDLLKGYDESTRQTANSTNLLVATQEAPR